VILQQGEFGKLHRESTSIAKNDYLVYVRISGEFGKTTMTHDFVEAATCSFWQNRSYSL